jgi:uncharacterized damage-inducible protein DinB
MARRDELLPEFEFEMASTRKTLERVPTAKFDWKPHEKSFSMGRLAVHIAEIPGWIGTTLNSDSLDFAPVGGAPYSPPKINTMEEVLAMFDKNVADGKAGLATVTDETLAQPWSLLKGGVNLMTMTKLVVVKSFVLKHAIHHRAQLGVYLRLNDIPVPSIYGPTADEPIF